MSDTEKAGSEDGLADALGAIAMVVIPVLAIVYFLSGLPA
jgi:hypothetical protein